MKPKAYSYVRFSSPQQAKGHSYKRQLDRAQQYADENHLELVTESAYAFFDSGKSAYTAKNMGHEGELKRFLELVGDGSIPKGSYLLIENLDRLSREKINIALPRFMDLLNSGIKVVTLTDGRVYDENYNELDLIISIVQMSRAHEESSSKGYRVSKAWKHKQDNARENKTPLGNACPAWLALEDGQYKTINSRVELIRRIFELSNTGWGRIKIVKQLNKENIKPWGSPEYSDSGKVRNKSGKWGTSTIAKILQNKAVIGEYQPHQALNGQRVPVGDPVKDYYPKIIDDALFYSTQSRISERSAGKVTKQSPDFNVWQKVAFCNICQSPMHLINKGRPPKGYKYIVCSNARKGACENPMTRYDVAEKVLPEILVRLGSLSLIQGNESSILANISELEGRAFEIKERLTKQQTIFSQHPSKSAAAIIQKSEESLETLDLEIRSLNDKIATSHIVDKESFFSSVDLTSYSQRHKANLLLRRLGIQCFFTSERGKKEDFPIYLQVHVCREGESMEENGFSILVDQKESRPEFQTMSREYASLGVKQNDVAVEDYAEYFGLYVRVLREEVCGNLLLRPITLPTYFLDSAPKEP